MKTIKTRAVETEAAWSVARWSPHVGAAWSGPRCRWGRSCRHQWPEQAVKSESRQLHVTVSLVNFREIVCNGLQGFSAAFSAWKLGHNDLMQFPSSLLLTLWRRDHPQWTAASASPPQRWCIMNKPIQGEQIFFNNLFDLKFDWKIHFLLFLPSFSACYPQCHILQMWGLHCRH